MDNKLKIIGEIIALGDTELLTRFISRSRITLEFLPDFTYMLLYESYKAKKPQFIQVIAETLCVNNYVIDQGIELYLYLLHNKNMTVEVCKWVLKNNPRLTFFYLVYNMLTFLYREDGLRDFLIMLRKASGEKNENVFQSLIEECNSEIDETYLEVLTQFKSKYSKGVYKDYVSNYGLTNNILNKYDNYEIPDTISEEDVRNIYFKEGNSEEENRINEEKLKELIDNKVVNKKFGDGDIISNVVKAFNNSKVEGKSELVKIMNEYILLDKIRNDEDFFRMLGPVNPGIGVKGSVCEYFGGCRMLTCKCYVETDTADFPDDELDVDWFTNECQYCNVRIPRRCDAMRLLVTERGWYGCFCGIDHAISSMFYNNVKEEEEDEEELQMTLQDKYIISRMKIYYNNIKTIGIQAQK